MQSYISMHQFYFSSSKRNAQTRQGTPLGGCLLSVWAKFAEGVNQDCNIHVLSVLQHSRASAQRSNLCTRATSADVFIRHHMGEYHEIVQTKPYLSQFSLFHSLTRQDSMQVSSQSNLDTSSNRNESSCRCRRAPHDRCLKCCHLSASAGGACSEGIAAPC